MWGRAASALHEQVGNPPFHKGLQRFTAAIWLMRSTEQMQNIVGAKGARLTVVYAKLIRISVFLSTLVLCCPLLSDEQRDECQGPK